jgi:hypothetical protein
MGSHSKQRWVGANEAIFSPPLTIADAQDSPESRGPDVRAIRIYQTTVVSNDENAGSQVMS